MLPVYVITATIFTLTVKTEGLKCFVEGKCVGATEISNVIVDTIKTCVNQCQTSKKCKFSTFDSNNNYCKKFEDICSEINKDECPTCLTSQKYCTVSICFIKKNIYL